MFFEFIHRFIIWIYVYNRFSAPSLAHNIHRAVSLDSPGLVAVLRAAAVRFRSRYSAVVLFVLRVFHTAAATAPN